ncbi:MAG: hypothetical protein IKD62_02390 [Oscillospiraceae bacterium]|nr:hypothetical protein [Oscillospiraceae bacterium]
MRERGTGILDYKKGTRYLKSSGILLREQSVDPASLYAAASAVAGMFGLSKKEELAERFCRAAYDGAYREAHLLILLLYWNMEERLPKFLKAIAANGPVFEQFCMLVSEQIDSLQIRLKDLEKGPYDCGSYERNLPEKEVWA